MAARFWVGGSGAWSDSSHWASSSGGAGGQSVPASSDAVTLDANSGGAGTIVTADTGATAASVTLAAGNVAQLLQSAAFTTPGAITVTAGTWDTGLAGNPLTAGSFTSSNSNVRTIRLNSSVVTITGTSSPWSMQTSTNLTFAAGTSTVTFLNAGINTIQAGTLTYSSFVIQKISNATTLTGAATYASFSAAATSGSTSATLTLGANITVTGVVTLTGVGSAHRLLVNSTNSGQQRTITAAARQIDYVSFQDVKGAGAAAPFAGTLLGDCLGCSGISFEPALTLYRVGAGGKWTDTGPLVGWALREGGDPTDPLDPDPDAPPSLTTPAAQRSPLPQDTVRVTASATGSISLDTIKTAKNLDLTGFSGTLTFAGAAWEVFGNATLSQFATYVAPPNLNLSGRGNHVLDVGGAVVSGLKQDAPGGTYTLARSVTSTGTFNLLNGTFDALTYDVTVHDFTSAVGNNTRELRLGTGVWTLTGTGVVWTITSNPALVLVSGAATIRVSDTSASTKTLTFNGRTNLPNIDLPAGGGAILLGTTSANSYNTLSVAGPKTIQLAAGVTTTIKALSVTASAGNVVAIESQAPGTQATLAKASGVVIADYLSIKDVAATGGAQWYAGSHSTNRGNNSGWLFSDRLRSLAFFHKTSREPVT